MPIEAGHYVLDTFAVLAYFKGEVGKQLVTDLIAQTTQAVRLSLSVINLGELAYITEREHNAKRREQVLADVRRLPLTIQPVSEARVLAAARLKARHPLSYADAFAVALAQELEATLVTGDPEIHALRGVARVLWV